jgi:hypothetical protein
MGKATIEATEIVHLGHALADWAPVLGGLPDGLVHPRSDPQSKVVALVDDKFHLYVVHVEQFLD